MTELAINLRRAEPGDAAAIAEVHVTSWRESYKGLVSDAELASLSVERRAAVWRDMLAHPDQHEDLSAYVAVDKNERVVGFAACGRQRSEELRTRFPGEFQAIYLLDTVKRGGVGRHLMRTMADDLASRGCAGAALWVLRDNFGARSFYERLGGDVICEKIDPRPTGPVVEVAYGWTTLHGLGRAD
jgi:ribosomal protein S18 acetylase RimI-like enzyme